MSSFLYRKLPEHSIHAGTVPPLGFRLLELLPRPERLPRGPRRIRAGLWSAPHYSATETGHELVAMTHADGHSILWPVRRPEGAALINPDGRVVDRPAAWREAHAFAFHWHRP